MNKTRKPANRFLTPYQLMEHQIREASNDASVSSSPRRTRPLRATPENLGQVSGPVSPGRSPTDDDLAPETLIYEDGARSPYEVGDDIPADQTYRVVRRDEAGGTFGLDEAELARVDPLDGEPWEEE